MANNPTDAVLDAQHDVNCNKIASWLLKLPDECLYAIMCYSEKRQDAKKACDARWRKRLRGECIPYHIAAPVRFCRICGKPTHGHGLCHKHHTRMREHGDPMHVRRLVTGIGYVVYREMADGTFVPLDDSITEYVRNGCVCVVCGKRAQKKRMCTDHYELSLYLGTPGELPDDVIAYQQALAKTRQRR